MANIQSFLDKIKSAIYGEEVRGSIVSAIEAMNEESSSAEQNTSTIVEKINASTASATGTEEGTSPTVHIDDQGTKFEFVFTIPKGDTGPQGPQGPQGIQGDPPPLSTSAPLALGVASSGSSTTASREDHIHPMPTAKDIGAASEEEFNSLKDDVAAITPDDTVVDGKPWTSKKTVDSLCMPIEATGNPVQVYPVEGYPLGVKVSWEPVQEGDGDPSPENIRPIKGRDSVRVERCGKNLVEHQYAPGYTVTENGVTFTVNDDYSITVNGTATADTYFNFFPIRNEDLIATYNINTMGKTEAHNGFEIRDIAVQPYPREHLTLLYLVVVNGTVVDTTCYPTIVYGSTAEPYEPYTGSKTDIALPETVYGGTLDVETGVVTVEWVKKETELGDTSLLDPVGNGFVRKTLPGISNVILGDANQKCNVAPYSYNFEGEYTHFYCDNTGYSMVILPVDTPAETVIQVSCKISVPYTIQLSPQQITGLTGVNTIFSDSGTLTVTGREDPRHTIVELKNAIISLGGNI